MALQAAINGDSDLYNMLGDVQRKFTSGWKFPDQDEYECIGIVGFDGPHSDFPEGNEEDVFMRVGFCLPDDCFAEIEDGTYGQLQCFRVYRKGV